MPTENRSSSNHGTRTFTLDSLTVALEQVQALHEISADLIAESVFGQPAQQQQSEPVAWLAKTLKGSLAGTLGFVRPYNRLNPDLYEGPFPVFRHADTAEVERLHAALKFYADREHYHFESGNWDTVSGEPLNILWCGDEPDFIEDGPVARNALSASAELEAKS